MHLSPDYGGTGAAHHRTTAAVALSFSDRLYWGPCLFIHDIKEEVLPQWIWDSLAPWIIAGSLCWRVH